MRKVSKNVYEAMERLSDREGVIGALAIDQRGSIKKMIGKYTESTTEKIEEFKCLVSSELTKYASSILLDPEYGLPASKVRDKEAGLLLAYEKTGYDATKKGRLPDILDEWSVRRLKEQGADAIKFLLYYDVDDDKEINEAKHIFVERLGSECLGEDLPFYLELVSYDEAGKTGKEYAKVRPHKVIEMMKEFSKERYNVTVLKMEIPVDMNYVEGYGEEWVYTREEAKAFYKQQAEATDLPFIFLSGGVSMDLFKKSLELAHEAGSNFNGVLCGRATWADAIEPYSSKGKEEAIKWLETEGTEKITSLGKVLGQTATDWKLKLTK
ncbi:tagatose-bisphosphate aldolase [Pseudostreptobacillus hongkongensis]|uniref:tagatose-bisphosphate aldolase n=1 Tax=Pseudostreptobacillus hongkongensis TaxID=1162717 RepID=UPI0028D833A7|nr:tagatose-bisphosphate aldolase [Pseudostreptobacillus hongkongensis]